MKKNILIVNDNTELNRVLQISLKDSYETVSSINDEDTVNKFFL